MGSIRDKFIALAKAGGNRKDFFNLAKSEGLTDKEKLAPKQKGNKWTKAFSAASGLNLEGKEKTSVFKKAGAGRKKNNPELGLASLPRPQPNLA